MSLSSIMNIATSGLRTSQSGISVVSQNATNVNTDGYVRLEQNQSALTYGGVEVSSVKRATNEYLESLYLDSTSDEAAASVKSEYLDQLQSIFGDPSDDTSVFSVISSALAGFESATADPTSTLVKGQIVTNLQSAISQLSSSADSITETEAQVESDISTTINDINTLLKNIVDANAAVTRGTVAGDASGAQDILSGYITELSGLIDINVDYNDDGVATVYTSNGALLASGSASTLSYSSISGDGSSSVNIQFSDDSSVINIEGSISGGTLGGLLDLRNDDLPAMSEEVNQLAGKLADAVNSVYSLNTTLPPTNSVTGSDTGLISSDSLGFTGSTSIGVADSSGTLVKNLDVDFDSGTITVDGSSTVSFGDDISSFVSALNSALGSDGTASFSNGQLNITASSSDNGIVFDEPETGGSDRAGKAFANYFGMNQLITSTNPTSYSTGISGTDENGFTAGDTFTLSLANGDGKTLTEKTITIPSGTFDDILTEMNDVTNGFGLYGTFSLDDDGNMIFTQNNGNSDYTVSMVDDTENRGDTSVTLGELFGLSDSARNSIASNISINSKILTDTSSLALAQVDLNSDNVGSVVIGQSDSSGAQALYDTASISLKFSNKALSSSTTTTTLLSYMSSVAGDIATRASDAETAADTASTYKEDAKTRLSNSIGVNIDEELVKLTEYQQAYSASARLITVVGEMFDTLLDAV